MSSLSLLSTREQYPGLSDTEIAEALAKEYSYIVVLRYKSRAAEDYDNVAVCHDDAEVDAYNASPFCYDVEVLYDERARSIRMTADLILMGSCQRCGKEATEASLTLMMGNDFYFCPTCGDLFCDDCYPRLPLTRGYSGYGRCPRCLVEVKRALPGQYGSCSSSDAFSGMRS